MQCRASVLRIAADQVDRGRKRLDPLARTVASTHEAFMNELRAAGMTPESSEDAP